MKSLPESSISASRSSLSGLAAGQSAGGGRYLLKKIVGQGGMGVVWLAHDKLLRELVALKFLPPQIYFDPAALEGLRRETLRARKLSHPHIIRIHDLNDVPDEPTFISMEYVDGQNLHALRAHRPSRVLTWKFLAPLVRQLCLALDYAHGERVIHRDLKPANLMLESNGRLKLADFGLARVITDSMSRLSGQAHTGGTVGYMSPQQADGRKDIAGFYALAMRLDAEHAADFAEEQRIQFLAQRPLQCYLMKSLHSEKIFQERGQPCPREAGWEKRGQGCPRSFGCGYAALRPLR